MVEETKAPPGVGREAAVAGLCGLRAPVLLLRRREGIVGGRDLELVLIAVAVVVSLVAINAMIRTHITYDWNADLLYVNGRYERTLDPGRHRFFRPFTKVDIFSVRRTEQWWTSGLTDVSSAERLPFRTSALIHFRVTNPQNWYVDDGYQRLQKGAAAALVGAISKYKIEDLLRDRNAAGEEVAAHLSAEMRDCEILGATVDTVQLPPETRRLFIEVERARLEGLAALERSRGEHAALRSLANAARLLKDNPELLNLRLLQTIGSGKGATVVLGQGALGQIDAATPGAGRSPE
jgi:regulator of protease activity HflC (stomatin/prohibitin superfamily)